MSLNASNNEKMSKVGFRYRAFGLEIFSELELPELAPGNHEAPIDLTISLKSLGRPIPTREEPGYFSYSADEQYMAWREVGGFLIRGVSAIEIDPNPDAPISLLSFPLLGPVIALFLHLRGDLVLHGSALARQDQCVILLGDKGAGKSTTAAMLMAGGFSLLADDVVCLRFPQLGTPLIAPAFPQLKLSNEAEAILRAPNMRAQAKPIPEFPKVPVRIAEPFAQDFRAPTHIYRLNRGPQTTIANLNTAEALQTLMRYSFLPLFERRQWRRSAEESARHFQHCARLANVCTVADLHVPLGLARGGELQRAVARDLHFELADASA